MSHGIFTACSLTPGKKTLMRYTKCVDTYDKYICANHTIVLLSQYGNGVSGSLEVNIQQQQSQTSIKRAYIITNIFYRILSSPDTLYNTNGLSSQDIGSLGDKLSGKIYIVF